MTNPVLEDDVVERLRNSAAGTGHVATLDMALHDEAAALIEQQRRTIELYETALSEAEGIFGGEYADHYGPMFELACKARKARALLQGDKKE